MLQIRVFKEPHRSGGLCFYIEDVDGQVVSIVDGPLTLRQMDSNELWKPIEPTVKMPMASGQQLIDDLWSAGLRPSEGTGSAGAFAAQGKHLVDLQRIVFRNYGDRKC